MYAKILTLLFLFAIQAPAETGFPISETPDVDLHEESQTLNLSQEALLESQKRVTNSYFGITLGITQPNNVYIHTPKKDVNYVYDQPSPLLEVSYERYGLLGVRSLGFSGFIGYSYLEKRDKDTTNLHLIPVNLSLAYRFDKGQALVPFFKLGPSYTLLAQRGVVEEYNTSEGHWLATAALGASLDLGRLGLDKSRSPAVVFLEWQKNIAKEEKNDLNGNAIQVGVKLNL